MIYYAEELKVEERTGERNGTMTHLLTAEQMHGKSRLFARIVLRPGARVPEHRHEGDFEAYYILSGTGRINDNGVSKDVKAGDVILTDCGESHALENTGDSDLEFMALITLV